MKLIEGVYSSTKTGTLDKLRGGRKDVGWQFDWSDFMEI